MHSENGAAGRCNGAGCPDTPVIVHVKREPDAQRYTAHRGRCFVGRVVRGQPIKKPKRAVSSIAVSQLAVNDRQMKAVVSGPAAEGMG